MKRFTNSLLVIGVALGALMASPAQAQQPVFPTHQPQMVGNSDGHTTTKKLQFTIYKLKQTDQDVDINRQLVIDTTCRVRPVKVMGGTFTPSLQGVDVKGEHTWQISGLANMTPGNYLDEWELYNDRAQGDVLRDVPLKVTQIVTVTD